MLRGYLAAPYTLHLQRNSAELIRNVTSSVDAAFSPVLGATVSVITEALVVLALIGATIWAIDAGHKWWAFFFFLSAVTAAVKDDSAGIDL